MRFDFAAAKAQARRVVHDTLAVQAFFKDTPTSAEQEITARYHSKLVQQGTIDGEGAQILEGADQVVFNRELLAELGITPVRGSVVRFPAYDLTLSLDLRKPYEGPIEEIWEVTRQ